MVGFCNSPVCDGSGAPEVAAVVNSLRELIVEPVGVDEVEHAGIAIDTDRGVVPPQKVVDACLLPELTNVQWIVEHIPETDDRATAGALEVFECRQKLAVRAGWHEIRDEEVRRDLADRLLKKLGPEFDHVLERQGQVTWQPGAAVDLPQRRQLHVVDSGRDREDGSCVRAAGEQHDAVRMAIAIRRCKVELALQMPDPHAVVRIEHHARARPWDERNGARDGRRRQTCQLSKRFRVIRQIVVRPVGGDAAAFDDDDFVRSPGQLQVVRRHNGCRSIDQLLQRVSHGLPGVRIETGGRLIQQQNRRPSDERARNRDPLALAAGERRTALGEDGVEVVG